MLFFMMIVLFGSFYLINLMLAVVAMAYEQEADVEAKVGLGNFPDNLQTPLIYACVALCLPAPYAYIVSLISQLAAEEEEVKL